MDRTLTPTQRKAYEKGEGMLKDDVPMSKAQKESSKRALSTGDVALGLVPVVTLAMAGRLMAAKGIDQVKQLYGKDIANAVSKFEKKLAPLQLSNKSPNNPLAKIGKGDVMNIKTGRFIKAESIPKFWSKPALRPAKMAASAVKTQIATAGVASLGALASEEITDSVDSRKRDEEIGEVVEAKPTPKPTPKPKPELVDRKGTSFSDDLTQDDYALRNKVSIRDKAKEENISDSAAEQNLRRGGPVKKKKKASKAGAAKTKYGMKKGGFTSKGGSYY